MTVKEFSEGFSTQLNSFALNFRFGDTAADVVLDEYEKSYWLTQAQKDLVITLYTGKNALGDSFESSEEMRRYLANIVDEYTMTPDTHSDGKPIGVESGSRFFTLPEDLWFITYESISIANKPGCEDGSTMDVVPVTQDEYRRIRKNPFRGSNRRRALRLDLADGVVEIVANYTIQKYYIRYIKKLTPIVLQNFTQDGLSIDGVSNESDCELHEALHPKILDLAVRMALQSKSIGAKSSA